MKNQIELTNILKQFAIEILERNKFLLPPYDDIVLKKYEDLIRNSENFSQELTVEDLEKRIQEYIIKIDPILLKNIMQKSFNK